MTSTGTDLERQVAVNNVTGEVLDLTLGTDALARARREVIDAKHELDDFAKQIDDRILQRMDMENLRSASVPDGSGGCSWDLKVGAPTVEKWPVEDLGAALDELITAGLLTEKVKRMVLVPQPPLPQPDKLAKAQLNKLLKHNDPAVRAKLEAVRVVENVARRSVTVKEMPPLEIDTASVDDILEAA